MTDPQGRSLPIHICKLVLCISCNLPDIIRFSLIKTS